jgi:hypothetical protein
MPIIETPISKVQSRPVRGGTKWDIYGAPAVSGYTPVYETWSALHASLCDRARILNQHVVMGLKDGRYGLEVVTAEIVQ